MAVTREIVELESARASADVRGEIHLWKEGTFLRAYDWSAWLCCRYLHDFKVTKRQFKDIDAPVAFIGFPETSLPKWNWTNRRCRLRICPDCRRRVSFGGL